MGWLRRSTGSFLFDILWRRRDSSTGSITGGVFPLTLAIWHRHADVVGALLDAGALVNWRQAKGLGHGTITNALQLAILVGHAPTLSLVIGDIERRHSALLWEGVTLFWALCFWGDSLVTHLMARGVRWPAASAHVTILRVAASVGCVGALEALIDTGVDMRTTVRKTIPTIRPCHDSRAQFTAQYGLGHGTAMV